MTRPSILFVHNDFYIINKPAGVTMHDSAQGIISQVLPLVEDSRLYLCHRLDDGTSGCLILARNAAAAARIGELFARRQIQKYYVALATAKPKKKQGTVSGDMKNRRQGQHILLKTREQPAVTQFFSQAVAPGRRGFVVRPLTGKTHQIRVALKSLGAPILGDDLYKGDPAERLYLHAWQLSFCYQDECIEVTSTPTGELFEDEACRHWLQSMEPVAQLAWPNYQLPIN
ncbi:TIGR01621 family pseudouridine synthase [Salinimonas marina]|uniref:TIGR01621 family pseudouridine synthase n=1 Tax=Salinimonas marina TaxID=2785918 RepID=A0A7S9DVZ7_9ALTE|nr:TIGR01621 family pseudouridine synthase [Salinimonas marina]QPG04862.1 TIGR01621 family pseudouridine synthase [Salinimonas marina]